MLDLRESNLRFHSQVLCLLNVLYSIVLTTVGVVSRGVFVTKFQEATWPELPVFTAMLISVPGLCILPGLVVLSLIKEFTLADKRNTRYLNRAHFLFLLVWTATFGVGMFFPFLNSPLKK